MSQNKPENELMAELERLKVENEKLKLQKQSRGEINFRVSEKGAVSVYGLGRFPVTLYKEQWLRLLAKKDDLMGFIQNNEGKLATK